MFDGSPVIAKKVEELKRAALDELDHIERLGGAIAAVEMGYMKAQLVESNTARLEAIERNELAVIGVNRFMETEPSPLTTGEDTIMTVAPGVEAEQIARLERMAANARRQGRRVRTRRPAGGGTRRPQHHAAVDRLRQSRRDHRRMGFCASRSVRRISRADRRRPRGAQRHDRARRYPRARSTGCRTSSAAA